MKIKATNIQYDLSDVQEFELDQLRESGCILPPYMIFEVDEDFDPKNELADLVSEETGWCVESCDYEVLA
jgi:hypothetical protein